MINKKKVRKAIIGSLYFTGIFNLGGLYWSFWGSNYLISFGALLIAIVLDAFSKGE